MTERLHGRGWPPARGAGSKLSATSPSDEAWWEDFYTRMLGRIAELRAVHAGDSEALAVLEPLERGPELHRRLSDHYAYELFVARRASQ